MGKNMTKQNSATLALEELNNDFSATGPANDQTRDDSGVWSLDELELDAQPKRDRADDIVLFKTYGPMVRRISLKTIRSLPRTITLDDIISAGWVGMSEALSRRPADMPQEQFEAYSSYRIRGAILDYLRHLDPLSRRLRGFARSLTRATHQLTHELGYLPDQEQIAKRLEMTLAQYQAVLVEVQEAGLDRIDANAVIEPPARSPSPETLASHSEILATVENYSKNLSERLQMVLSLHYEHECSLREIGDILGVTESRVCQLHSEAVQRIRAQFEGKPASSVRRRRGRVQSN